MLIEKHSLSQEKWYKENGKEEGPFIYCALRMEAGGCYLDSYVKVGVRDETQYG